MITNQPWLSSYPLGVPYHLHYGSYGSLLDLLDESFDQYSDRPEIGRAHV